MSNERFWTPRALAVLREQYPGWGAMQVSKLIGIKYWRVKIKARELGLQTLAYRYWTGGEDGYLRRWAGRKTAKEIAQKLFRTRHSILARLRHLGLNIRVVRGWTDREHNRLRREYASIGPTKLARWMGRTVYSVALKAKRLGLSKRPKQPSGG